jgi:hypothetical protein
MRYISLLLPTTPCLTTLSAHLFSQYIVFAALIVRLVCISFVVSWSLIVSWFAIIFQECSVLFRHNKFYCVFIGRIKKILLCFYWVDFRFPGLEPS